MSKVIRRQSEQLLSYARSARGAASHVTQLIASLDAAVAPALRGDVPNEAAISSQYHMLRGAMNLSASRLNGLGGELAAYVKQCDEIELLYKRGMAVDGLRTLLGNLLYNPGSRGHTNWVALAWSAGSAPAMEKVGGWADGVIDEFHVTDKLSAKLGVAMGVAKNLKLLEVALLVNDLSEWKNKNLVEKGLVVQGAVNLTPKVALRWAEWNIAKLSFGEAALLTLERLNVAGMGISIGMPIGNAQRAYLERMEAQGYSRWEAANMATNAVYDKTHSSVLAGGAAGFEYTTAATQGVAEHAGKFVFNTYYGVHDEKDEGPELAGHTQAAVLASIKTQYPNSHLWVHDGVVTVVSSGTNFAHDFDIDLKTGQATFH